MAGADRRRMTAEGRRSLDRALAPLNDIQRPSRPQRGWVKAIRNALGMTAGQLAAKVGVTQPTIQRLETSEAAGTIQLKTLKRLAEALDCELVYALVPRVPLQQAYEARAREVALQELGAIRHTMALEDQRVTDEDTEDLLRRYIDHELDPRELWAPAR